MAKCRSLLARREQTGHTIGRHASAARRRVLIPLGKATPQRSRSKLNVYQERLGYRTE